MKLFLYFVCFAFVGCFITGCSHNINVQGFGIATPYGAMGYGTFTCAKENTTVESEESVDNKGIVNTKNKFTIGRQITGAYVDAVEAGASYETLDKILSEK